MAASVSTRSYLIAGMAAVSAGAIAIAPVQPVSHDLAALPQQVSSLAVGLAASIDPVTPWIETLQAAGDNVVGLFNAWASDPFPIIQQVVANQFTYLSELPDIGLILSQVVGNVGNAIRAPFAVDTSTLNEEHDSIWTLLPALVTILENLQPVLDFTTTFLTGALLGLAGPVLAPVIQLGDSLSSIVGNLVGGDIGAALNDLINIPANLVNAFLNGGQVLDLTPLVNLLGIAIPNTTVNSIGLALGGLLSPGGSLFNALDANLTVDFGDFDVDIELPGVGPGVIGSVIGLTNTIANSIAVTPPAAASARSAAAVEAPAPIAEVAEPAAEVAVTAADVADVVATADQSAGDQTTSDGDNSTSTRGGRDKVSRSGGDAASAGGQDAPKRSGKAGASRAG